MKFESEKVLDIVLGHLPKIFFPMELMKLDLAISATELLALMIVDRHQEVIMSQISTYINAPLSTTTGVVNRLVSSGYLNRERSEDDRRIVAIQLTKQGKDAVAGFKNQVSLYLERINQALSEEESDTLFRITLKIMDAFSEKDSRTEDNQEAGVKRIVIE